MKPKIAFCVITEGDEKLTELKNLLASVRQYVDTVHITGNGKETKQVEAWCNQEGFDFSYLAWNDDFGHQRNFNFSQVPDDTDFILWADSDDVIVGAEYLPYIAEIALKNEHDAVFFSYWYGCKFNGKPSEETLQDVEITQMRERLLRKGKFVWKKRIHETPIPVSGSRDRYTSVEYSKEYPIAWLHLGADRDMTPEQVDAKMNRNRRLLEAELSDERKAGQADPRTLLYLMKIYAESEDAKTLQECIAMGEEYLEKSGWDQERALCLGLMAKCHSKLGDDQKSIPLLHKAIGEWHRNPLIYLWLAKAYYNLKNYSAMEHWMKVGLSIPVTGTNISNLLEMKLLSAELMMRFNLDATKNVHKAYEAAVMLHKSNPVEINQQTVDHLYDLKELDTAASHTHKLVKYLEDIEATDRIVPLLESLPQSLRQLPFAHGLYNKHTTPRVWGENEICYYATFGGPHFERWSAKSLQKGIGGSETAVIQLAKEWTKLGYRVTVYGDPGIDEGDHEGVTYLPWYKFNRRDHFNIFIQWRSGNWAGQVACKQFLVDLHDVWSGQDYLDKLDAIDKFMVKSDYHRNLAPEIPDDKFLMISNGI